MDPFDANRSSRLCPRLGPCDTLPSRIRAKPGLKVRLRYASVESQTGLANFSSPRASLSSLTCLRFKLSNCCPFGQITHITHRSRLANDNEYQHHSKVAQDILERAQYDGYLPSFVRERHDAVLFRIPLVVVATAATRDGLKKYMMLRGTAPAKQSHFPSHRFVADPLSTAARISAKNFEALKCPSFSFLWKSDSMYTPNSSEAGSYMLSAADRTWV